MRPNPSFHTPLRGGAYSHVGLHKNHISSKVRACEADAILYATLEWVDWFNNRRLLEPIGNIPPVEFEMAYYRQMEESTEAE